MTIDKTPTGTPKNSVRRDLAALQNGMYRATPMGWRGGAEKTKVSSRHKQLELHDIS